MDDFSRVSPNLRTPLFIDSEGISWVASANQNGPLKGESLEQLVEARPETLYMYKLDPKTNIEDDQKKWTYLNDAPTIVPFEGLKKLQLLGYNPIDLLVKKVVKGSPAEKAGIKENDIVFSISGEAVTSFEQMKNKIQSLNENEPVNIELYRNKEKLALSMVPNITVRGEMKIKTVGVYSAARFLGMDFVDVPSKGIFESAWIALERTVDTTKRILVGFKQLVTNQVSFKNLGGPLAIGKVASDSFNIGWSYFLKLMALISINLGVINLFPIPVLDGGHIMFIVFELVNGGPLSRRKMEIAQQFGLSLLFLLIFVALANDISKLL